MEARTIHGASPSRRYEHGEALIRQGEVRDCLFLIRSGAVRLAAVLPSGREVVVAVLGPGDLFGEAALLGHASPVDARALGAAVVQALPLPMIETVIRRRPEAASEIVRLLASRLHGTSAALQEALAHDVPTRVSSRLRDLAAAHGRAGGDGVRLSLPLTQEELARMVGATRETVNRVLRNLARRGLVRCDGHRYVITDLDALAAVHPRSETP
jgi:CRP/FNR family transcriptional regulator, cyclic AMP receptor protein